MKRKLVLPRTQLRKLRLYVQTSGYLRGGQLAQLTYRRILRRGSKPHRALDRLRVRERTEVVFAADKEARSLDALAFAGRDTWPEGEFDWHTAEMWQPLRYQLHYFDYLNDSSRPDEWKHAILTDWIEKNPPDTGDGWIPYAVSLRVVNWIKFFLQTAPEVIEGGWLVSLYGHALWLESNLELHILANHYLKNAKALLFAGLFFEGVDADRWQTLGLRLFLEQLQEQFLADGGHYERSPMYHAIAVEDILEAHHYLNAGSTVQSAATLETLRRYAFAALDFVSAIQLPDGSVPLFNDSAYGVGASPASLYRSAQQILGYQAPVPVANLSVRALAASGYYVIRHAENMLVVDCGPLGPEYQPGHGHCDCLSYELAIKGKRLVVDTGVFDYEKNAARQYARSTSAHNTIQIDSLEQSEMWDVFRVARRAYPIAPSLTLTKPDEAAFVGAHDGFSRTRARAMHRRSIYYRINHWTFEDRVEGVGHHAVESRVHLRPGLEASLTANVVEIAEAGGPTLAKLCLLSQADLRLERASYYPHFGSVEQGIVVLMTAATQLPLTMIYSIVPMETSSNSSGLE